MQIFSQKIVIITSTSVDVNSSYCVNAFQLVELGDGSINYKTEIVVITLPGGNPATFEYTTTTPAL
jgi:hypothetical protein